MEETNKKELSYLEKETVEFNKVIEALTAHKILLIILMFLFSASFFSYSFLIEDKFRSDALLQTSNEISGNKNNINYGSLASLAGISVGEDGSDKSILALEVIKSRDFLRRLIKNPLIKEKLYPKNLENFNELHKIFNNDIVSLIKDKSSGFIRISVTHPDAIFSKKLLELIIDEINLLQKEKDLRESTNALDYLNIQYSSKTLTNIRDSINKLVEEQLQIQMLSNIREDYVFSYIDRPYIPQEKDSPIRTIYIILGLFFGLIIGIIYIFIKEFVKK